VVVAVAVLMLLLTFLLVTVFVSVSGFGGDVSLQLVQGMGSKLSSALKYVVTALIFSTMLSH